MYEFRRFISDRGIDGDVINVYLNSPTLRISEIAQKFSKSEGEIYRILHAHDISPNRLKINHQKVQHLSHLGWGVKEIAEFTGYTPRNVRYIISNISEGNK
jgi:DNA-binding NarL/FixJ family response regulator